MVEAVLGKALAGEETESYELPLTTRTGEAVVMLLNATARRNESGEVVGVVGIGQDVTEMKRALAAETNLLHTLDNSFDLVTLIELKDGVSTRT